MKAASVSVWDLDALRVKACSVPCDAVEVRDADSAVARLTVPPTGGVVGRTDLIVWADDQPHLHVARSTPDPGDVVLAQLRMPACCRTVTNAMLVDRRSMPQVQQIALAAREGGRVECCRRWLIDSTHLGEASAECARRGAHDWLYDGNTCCLVGRSWHQTCHCGAARWTKPPLAAV